MTSGNKAPWEEDEKRNISHTERKKVIWKGKMAPKGWVYLIVKLNQGKQSMTAGKLVKGGNTLQEEKLIYLEILNGIKEHLKIK